ncbi:unnamed protein product [Darwinula stevensoni]|uniref:Testin n=1 Tax=Darwinula stevensoni TaxID=69355 RepID=A0A7R9A826_9CRUS|nr:unnamed protein product [Darwinula stevensoni]CAG0894723.1 unnamed protein product [Darwinula stevensoni]
MTHPHGQQRHVDSRIRPRPVCVSNGSWRGSNTSLTSGRVRGETEMAGFDGRAPQPNPYLFEIEAQKNKKATLAHEVGAGSPCKKCEDKCPGFDLHYWRKICRNCKCGKEEHDVYEEVLVDPGYYRIGRLFDRPLRTTEEELKYSHGKDLQVEDRKLHKTRSFKFDWIPPGITDSLRCCVSSLWCPMSQASKYMEMLPESHLPISGSEGAFDRRKRLSKQIPAHDMELGSPHQKTPHERKMHEEYLRSLKENAVGQGSVRQCPAAGETLEKTFAHSLHIEVGKLFAFEIVNVFALEFKQKLNDFMQDHEKQKESEPTKNGFSMGLDPDFPPPPSPLSQGVTADVGPQDIGLKCFQCQEPLPAGEVAVFAERAGPNRAWHPQCFVCCHCKELLVDLIYFHANGQIYCGRDFAQICQIPRCKACDEVSISFPAHLSVLLIFSKMHTQAEGSAWHTDHFCCFLCDQPLAGKKYIPQDGHPHCLPCFQASYGKRCETCKGDIAPEGRRVCHNSLNWHADDSCFRCHICQTSLLNAQFLCRNALTFCSRECVAVAKGKNLL